MEIKTFLPRSVVPLLSIDENIRSSLISIPRLFDEDPGERSTWEASCWRRTSNRLCYGQVDAISAPATPYRTERTEALSLRADYRSLSCGVNTANLFVCYAQPETTTGMTTKYPTSDCKASGHRRISSWGSSLEDFEIECDLYLQTNEKLPRGRSSIISHALKRAVQETSNSDSSLGESEWRNSRFSTYLRDAFGKRGMSDTEVQCDHSSTRYDEDFIREKLKRQTEEIQFLRSTVKALVHSDDTERPVPAPCKNGESIVLAKVVIPKSIQIRRPTPIVDDLTEDEFSDVTSSEGGGNFTCEDIHGFTGIPEKAPKTPCHQVSPTRIFDFETKSLWTRSPLSPPLSPPDQAHGRRPLCDAFSFPNMAKGEVQYKRARCMACSIYFPTWGIMQHGKYSGAVRNRRPNGSGVLRFQNHDYYVGSFKEGMLHGEGALFLRRNGRLLKFRGQFERNEFVGGRLQKPTTSPLEAHHGRGFGYPAVRISL